MKVAVYAPLKSPEHPVPSGDRLMARMLMAALREAGHEVTLASHLRSFRSDPEDWQGWEALQSAAMQECDRLQAKWQRQGAPDLWLCYHPYYKAPDLIGPALCDVFSLPYVTVEASYSARRNLGIWAEMQASVRDGVRRAAVNICLTQRDQRGLQEAVPEAHVARLAPFLEAQAFLRQTREASANHLLCVAMMRRGDKLASYRHLAASLAQVTETPWHLTIVGDGPARPEVEALFAGFPPDRIRWAGQQDPAAIAALMSRAALYVWPGCGEAFGLAYLEAQAAGVPVLAWRTGGISEVVVDGTGGVLTPEGDDAAYARAISALLQDERQRAALAQGARAQVAQHHTLGVAATALDGLLSAHLKDMT